MSLIALNYPAEFQSIFKDLKIRQKLRFMILKVNTDSDVAIEHQGARDATFADMAALLPENEPRYVIYDVPVSDDGKITKLVFIFWSPAASSPKNRMVYASAKDGVRNTANGCQREIQVTDVEDFTEGAVRAAAM